MAEEAPTAAPAAPAPTKAPKKKRQSTNKDGTSLPKLIVAVIADSKDRKGTSLAAVKKSLGVKGIDVVKCNKRINSSVARMVTKGILVQTKGSGASGSFKIAKKEAAPKKPKVKAVVKAKKPAVKKSAGKKATTPKKTAKKPAAKKPAAKKAAAKPAKKSSPKKKAAVKKSKPKSPAKAAPKARPAKKPAAKSAKKPAAKKSAAKKGKK
ncbi:histone H1-like [Aulostomus maculatus]